MHDRTDITYNQDVSNRAAGSWLRPMVARSGTEPHRAATPLELLFDLCFVVAVALAGMSLHHAVSEDHIGDGTVSYLLVFFAIWWAWMNFTWFASAYDTDDVPYRVATLVQMAGVLVVAAGVPRAFDDRDFVVVTLGYGIIRLALAGLWLRAAHSDDAGRTTALRFAVGITTCWAGWIVLLVLSESVYLLGFLLMVAAELSVPVWAERAHATTWHPRHIAERYGLFTIIVLGETILAATAAVQAGLDAEHAYAASDGLTALAVSALFVVFSMWWLYFDHPAHRFLSGTNRNAFLWGYGHYLIFSSAAAVGAGLAVAVDYATHRAHIGSGIAGGAVTVPVAVYLLSVWLLHVRPHRRGTRYDAGFPVTAGAVLAATATPWPFALPLTAVATTALVVACHISPQWINHYEQQQPGRG
ncbi:hypothetical protein FDG2_5178 [Candidatus Protofrankia californiensis]|uniref:Low temperature requirement A n=1 Tax=Candidatus Protofrankia californiensis TaxID=1839754 RepID=A0A1C3PBA5_9ACTN|nr:hypothetical protein FDG2_5178 [Candidatus Protofrankia californiensis]